MKIKKVEYCLYITMALMLVINIPSITFVNGIKAGPSSYEITIVEDNSYPGWEEYDLAIDSASAQKTQDGWTIDVTVKNNALCKVHSGWGWYSSTGRSCWGEWDFHQDSDETVDISFRVGDSAPRPGAKYRVELVVDGLFLGNAQIEATNSWYLVTIHDVLIEQGPHTLFIGTYQMDYHPDYHLDYILIGDQKIEAEDYDRMGGNDPNRDLRGLYIRPLNVVVEFWEGDPYSSGILIGESDVGKEQEVIDRSHVFSDNTFITYYIENNGVYSASYDWIPSIEKDTYEIYTLIKSDTNIADEINSSNNLKHLIISEDINLPPSVQLLYPTGGEILKDTIDIEWSAHDNSGGDNVQILIYLFDSSNDFTRLTPDYIENTGSYSWDTTTVPDGEYKIQTTAIQGDDNYGYDTSNLFTVKNHEDPIENHAPNKPAKPTGEASGKTGESYTYTTMTNDPDGDQIWFNWDFGDEISSGWVGPYTTGEICEVEHTWDEEGEYSIRVKAKDMHGEESPWSDPLAITMPKNKAINPFLLFLERLIEHFPILEQILQPIYDKLAGF